MHVKHRGTQIPKNLGAISKF